MFVIHCPGEKFRAQNLAAVLWVGIVSFSGESSPIPPKDDWNKQRVLRLEQPR